MATKVWSKIMEYICLMTDYGYGDDDIIIQSQFKVIITKVCEIVQQIMNIKIDSIYFSVRALYAARMNFDGFSA